ncbi:hypothetical protein XENOCAPTIV_019588, partial [Xenoophorus captivus]
SDFQTVQPAERRGSLSALGRDTALLLSDLTQGASNWIQSFLDPGRTLSDTSFPSHRGNDHHRASAPAATSSSADILHYPDGFEPLRSECHAYVLPTSCPVIRNPFVSPLLAPTNLLKGLPPVHLVASALDALLDDSVMFAKKLRAMGQPVTLVVVDDLPHGFLSLAQICKETQFASEFCVARIREIFQPEISKRSTPAET